MKRQLDMFSMTSSQIIRTYKSANYSLVMRDDKQRLIKFQKAVKKRRSRQVQNMESMNIKPSEEDKNKNELEKFLGEFKTFQCHTMSLDDLKIFLQTDLVNGLNSEEAERRLQQSPNIIEDKTKKHWALVFLSQMSDPFSLFIWFLIVLSFIGYGLLQDSNQLLLAIILLITIFSGAIISFGFVKETQSAIQDFQDLFPQFSTVIRNSEIKTIKSKKVVKGDIITLRKGEKIPADIRIINSAGLKVNRATFTGQSYPVEMSSQCTDNQNPLESLNIVYSGMVIVEGEAQGVVVQTGQSTLICKIQKLLMESNESESYIEKQLSRFVKYVTIFAVFIGCFTFAGGALIGFPVVIAADIAIGVLVASAPGVLNLELVCILYFSVKKLAQKNLICKTLVAVETFGATQILCTDKTGTLTTNRMTVNHIYYNDKIFEAVNLEDSEQVPYNLEDPTFKALKRCAILSSMAVFNNSPPRQQITKISSRKDIIQSQKILKQKQIQKIWEQNLASKKVSQRQVLGDSTQSALIRFFHPIENIEDLRSKYPITNNKIGKNRVSFNSRDKYSLSINLVSTSNSDLCIFIKGAPQKIWDMCKYVLKGDKEIQKDQLQYFKFRNVINSWGKQGKRVLGFAQLHLPSQKYPRNFNFNMEAVSKYLKNMTFLGLASLHDPPRKGLNETITKIKNAQIKVIMVTGDQQITAVSIARQCNIISNQPTAHQIMEETGCEKQSAFYRAKNIVITGDDITTIMNNEYLKPKYQQGKQFIRILEKPGVIFARTNPTQKLYIVEQLQKLGYIVSVTGDGVNDSPAIKRANTGLAMSSGSDAAKDSSDIVIGNDDLNSIYYGIEQGRRAFDNLKKAICYVMTSQISEWAPFVFLIVTQIPIPIFTLLIDGATDFVPTVAFAFEESQKGIMTRPPKIDSQHLINFPLIAQCQGWMGFSSFLSCLLAYYIVMVDFGYVPAYLWWRSNIPIMLEGNSDIYNPSSPYFGNSNLAHFSTCQDFRLKAVRVDWINTSYPGTDLRMSGVSCHTNDDGTLFFKQVFAFGECRVQQISFFTNKPVCYTPEATKYGQTAYMCANVINQIFNWIICRTRRDSAITKRFTNKVFMLGLSLEAMLALSLTSTSFMMSLIGTRDCIFQHYGICTIPFSITQLCLDQLRKYFIRTLPRDKDGKPNWFERNTLW